MIEPISRGVLDPRLRGADDLQPSRVIPPAVLSPGIPMEPGPGNPPNRPACLDFRQSNFPLVTES